MREIKFRAWDKFQNRYVFTGFHVIGEVTVFGGIESVIDETAKERKEKYGYETSTEAWDDFILEQYTGLKDKNGKGIYEGDIVRSGDYYTLDEGTCTDVKHQVFWSDSNCCWYARNIENESFEEDLQGNFNLGHFSKISSLEIIGNIHEEQNNA